MQLQGEDGVSAAPGPGHAGFLEAGSEDKVSLNDLQAVDASSACGMSYDKLAALYFDRSMTPEVQAAFLQLLPSFSKDQTVDFPYVRTADCRSGERRGPGDRRRPVSRFNPANPEND